GDRSRSSAMAMALERLPWRLPTKSARAVEEARPSRKQAADRRQGSAQFPEVLSLAPRLPLEPQLPISPAPKRWSSRSFSARNLRPRPCYRPARAVEEARPSRKQAADRRQGSAQFPVVLSLAPRLPLEPQVPIRSEEHTSELQSLAYLVCRLL